MRARIFNLRQYHVTVVFRRPLISTFNLMPTRKTKAVAEPSTLRRSARTKTDAPAPVDEIVPVTKKAKTEPKIEAEKRTVEDEQAPVVIETGVVAEDKELEVGDEVPDVVLRDQEGEDVSVKSVTADKTVVIFAYPKASTPGCTRQACGFRDEFPKFEKAGVAVFGLSADSVSAQKNFQTKQKLPYQLLADTKYELIGPLGAKKTAKGGITRSYWVIKEGKIAVKVIGVKPEVSVEKAVAEATD
ncbi:thioredoxin-like protein [Lipomyces arxii]|uniref:thioredoxin-like protein n=1 Tax=Lipomyces arxii TaxID=56418 RepID=UPI0034D006AA